jgi:hypothetical protein
MYFENVRNETVIIGIMFLIIFYNLNFASKKSLLSIIIISIFAIFAYYYLFDLNKSKEKININSENFFNNEILDRNETNDKNFFINKFPKKKLKFFLKNKKLVSIAKDIVITRMFDKSRYADLLNLMNEYNKVYTYILGERYEVTTYIGIFIDLGKSILENLYSIYFIIPKNLKHVYGLDTYAVIDKNIEEFTLLNYEMINIIKSFSMKQLKVPYFPEIDPVPVDKPFNYINNRILP